MTKSNNEWVPEVGTDCEYRLGGGHWFKCKIKAVCEKQGAIIYCDAAEYGEQYVSLFGNQAVTFRPIKTEAEKRLDELTGMLWNDLDKFYEGTDCTTSYNTARYLISVGWMKSQPLTDDVIDSVMKHAKFSLTTYRGFAKAIEAYIRGEG